MVKPMMETACALASLGLAIMCYAGIVRGGRWVWFGSPVPYLFFGPTGKACPEIEWFSSFWIYAPKPDQGWAVH